LLGKLPTHRHPFPTLRRHLTTAVVGSAASLLVPVLAVGWWLGWPASVGVAAGGAVVMLPNGWLAWKMSVIGVTEHSAALAVTKFLLSGLGFAVLFATVPTIHAPGVFLGVAWSLVSMPLLVVSIQRMQS